MTNKIPSLSIIIPARNEAGNIRRLVESIPPFPGETEIIIIENNSRDDTWQETLSLQRQYAGPHRIVACQEKTKGKRDAVRKGFELARNDILMILDADGSVDPAELTAFYEAIVSGKADFINATRLIYPMEAEAMRPLNLLGNKLFARYLSWVLGQNLTDSLCGTKVVWRTDYMRIRTLDSLIGNLDPFGDFDLLIGAGILGLRIHEIPVHYKRRIYGKTNISRFRDGWELCRLCLRATLFLKIKRVRVS